MNRCAVAMRCCAMFMKEENKEICDRMTRTSTLRCMSISLVHTSDPLCTTWGLSLHSPQFHLPYQRTMNYVVPFYLQYYLKRHRIGCNRLSQFNINFNENIFFAKLIISHRALWQWRGLYTANAIVARTKLSIFKNRAYPLDTRTIS